MLDLIEYGIERFNLDFKNPDRGIFKLWSNYKKEQVMTLLKKDPRDKMKGTKYIEDVTYIFVTVIKGDKVQSSINYDDGYITEDTFQWESENSLSRADLNKLVNSSRAEVFVRKAKAEKGYTLPFTYVGFGKLNLIKDSLTDRGSYIFNISMHDKASQEIYFDFRRQNNVNEGLGAQL